MKEKTCFKCGITQTLDNFYKHSRMSDGHIGKCKTCNKKDVQENYALRRQQYSEYDQKRRQRPERKQKQLEYQRQRRQREPEKDKARYAVSNAVRDGRLTKQPCEVCGDSKSQE